jgi:predicted nucleic acid-binding protein
VLQAITVIPLDEISVDTAVTINNILKRKRKQIDLADLFIAATAVAYNLSLATLNKKVMY